MAKVVIYPLPMPPDEDDYAAIFVDENKYCALCECFNGHSLNCPTINKKYIEGDQHPVTDRNKV